MPDQRQPVAMQFDDADQQQLAGTLGMWVFLITEIMLFGVIFMGILVNRYLHPEAVQEASRHLDMWLGGFNTAVLLTSSLTMAMAVEAARHGRRCGTVGLLAATGGLGVVFLAIKLHEYLKEYHEGLMPGIGPDFPLRTPGAELFFNLYFGATGLHALHLMVGVTLVATVAVTVWRRAHPLPHRHMVVLSSGLYWHFVDVVWIFLYPTLYLIDR